MCSRAFDPGPASGLSAAGTAGSPEIVIAYLGPPNSFTHLALAPLLAKPGHIGLACETAADVVDLVAGGRAGYGFLAVETNLAGVVSSHCAEIARAGLVVVSELQYRAAIALAALPGVRVEEIVRVWSHEHPLLECARWLTANLRDAERVPVSSSSEAARRAASDPDPAAALCSSAAAEEHDLGVLLPDVADPPGDITRFAVLGRPGSEARGLIPPTPQTN